MFSIDQLEAFVITVEQGSFSAAARRLGKVQSAISQHVMNLEIDCGVDLFDRSGRYPQLTEHGQQLLPFAQASLIQHQRLINCANQLNQEQYRDITLAIDEGIPLTQLSQALKDVSNRFSQLRFECLAASSIDIRQLVREKRATMGIMFSESSVNSYVDFEGLGVIEFDVYVAKDHPLAQQTLIHLDMLRLYRQVVLRSKTNEMSSFQQAYSPDVWFADNYYILTELVSNGFGWGMLPKHLAEGEPACNKLTRLRSQFENLSWQANIDVIQHQSVLACPAHKYLRQRLSELRNQRCSSD